MKCLISTTYSGNEELRTVGVGTSVSHGQETGSVVTHSEVLISELVSVDRLTSITIEILYVTIPILMVTYGDISSLEHEVGDDSVEDGVLVAKIDSALSLSLLSSAQASEVLSSLRNNIIVQLNVSFHQTSHTSKTILPAGAPPMEMSKKT